MNEWTSEVPFGGEIGMSLIPADMAPMGWIVNVNKGREKNE